MDPDKFSPEQRTHVRWAEGGYWSFIPPKLPPDIVLSPTLVALLSEADRAIGQVSGLGRTLPNPHLLATSILRREAVLSSKIEGTRASMSDLVLFELEPRSAEDPVDVREVANYVRAADFILDADRRLPMSLPLLKQAHAILMQDVRGGHATPGEFRRSQNWIAGANANLDTATYMPPSPNDLWTCLDAFEKFLHTTDPQPPLLRIGQLHYQFEAIHPFPDGNGRIGRLLVVALMVDWGLLPAPLLDFSAYIEPRRDEYYEALLKVSTEGNWQGWLEFFLNAVRTQALTTASRAEALSALRSEYRARVASPRSSALLPGLVDELFATPALTINRAREILNVTHRAATLNVEKLRDAGILTEIRTVGRTRLFLAEGILETLREDQD